MVSETFAMKWSYVKCHFIECDFIEAIHWYFNFENFIYMKLYSLLILTKNTEKNYTSFISKS